MKGLTAAFCVDDGMGMMIFGKRQSRDRVLIADFIQSASQKPIYISTFSKILFEAYNSVIVTDDPVKNAAIGGVCFIENIKPSTFIDQVNTLILYRWNREYPSDVKFDIDIESQGFKLSSVYEFKGSSHENITKEIYVR